MHTPITTLAWEIWRRHRVTIRIIAAILFSSWLFNLLFAHKFGPTGPKDHELLTINCLLIVAALLLVFSTFNYTEFSPQREWTGFPYRLFTLPVASLTLIAVPLALGVSAVELVYFISLKLIFRPDELAKPEWFAFLLGAYMVFYQSILWTLAGFRILRIIVLGLIGTSFVWVAFLPFFAQYASSPWFSEPVLITRLTGLVAAAFAAAWIGIARQRCGGGKRRSWLQSFVDQVVDALPGRKKDFRSASAAQFWFEWRRAGMLLPACVTALLVLVIGPLSWILRSDPGSSVWILAWTLMMPMVLAFPLGNGFAKADFWSNNLSLPTFISTRPIPNGELIVTKMKVAALSTVISWLLVLIFLTLWLPLWADLEPLMTPRIGIWMTYGHSMWAEYVISALLLVGAALVTWRLLVGGLWVGLSGNRKLFLTSIAAYCFIPIAAFIALTILLNHDREIRAWATNDPDRTLSICEWIVALAVIAKFWLAAYSWRRIAKNRARIYLLLWTSSTLLLLAFAILIWAHGALSLLLMAVMDFLPMDTYRLRNLLTLLALLVIPFGRMGFAPSALAKNRHR